MNQSLQAMNLQNKLAEYGRMVRSCRSSGKSVKSWCSENNIPQSTYYHMQRKLYEAAVSGEDAEFIQLSSQHLSETTSCTATIRTVSVEVDIYCGADEETIRNILKAIKSC